MAETCPAPNAKEEVPGFEPDQKVTVQDLRRIVSPQNTLDPVEEARLRMVGTHVTELLRSDLPAGEASIHETFLYNLGAEEVLEHLPGYQTG